MKKKCPVILTVLLLYCVLASFTYEVPIAIGDNVDAEEDLTENIADIVDKLDVSEWEQYLSELSDDQRAVFGTGNLKEQLKAVIGGDLSTDYGSFFAYLGKVFGISILNYLPILAAVIAIAVAYNLMNSLRGKFASESVQNIVYFACVSLLIVLLFTQIFSAISAVRAMVQNLQRQMNIVFPILLTLMSAIGATSSVSVYQPSVAILSNGISELITVCIVPAFLISTVLTAIGNLSDGVKLGRLSEFFAGAAKWLLGAAFFVFSAFLGVQGITASVYDGVSVRTAKFAISKYVPVIGGYLSDGLNLVMSGSVLVKNAVGSTAIVLLFVSILPVVFQVVLLSLCLRLSGALIEPLGDSRMSALVATLGKNLTLLVSIVLAIVFLYFIFIILIICTGNLAL